MIPEVTVLMCVHNGERFLREAMGSILQQTLHNFEFLIVDDGSTDATPEIIRSFHDSRIRVIRNENNLGLTKSLNRGLREARSPLIARLDADDISEPHRLEFQLTHLHLHPEIALLGTYTTEINEQGDAIGKLEVIPSPGYIAWDLCRRNIIYQSSAIFRKSAVGALGGFDESIPYAQDHDLWTRILMNGGIISILPERLTRYRRSEGQITRLRSAQQEACSLGVCERYIEWMLKERPSVGAIRMMRALLSYRELIPDESMEEGLRLLFAIRKHFQGRIDPGSMRAIDQFTRDRLLNHARNCLHFHRNRNISMHLTRYAMKSGRAPLSRGVVRQYGRIARSLFFGPPEEKADRFAREGTCEPESNDV